MILGFIEFKINIATIIALITGIVIGITLFVMLYVLSSIQTINKNNKKISKQQVEITDEDIKNEINYALEKFEIKSKESKEINFDLIKNSCYELMETIARKFYPSSKHPLGELTIHEMIQLDRYIMDKIETLLTKNKGLRLFNKMRVNQFLKALNIKKNIEKSKAAQIAKKYNIKKVTSGVGKVIGVFNPASWAKNLITTPFINMLSRKICRALIKVTGEETYHVYSKQAFMDNISDDDFEAMLSQIENQNEEIDI